MAPVQKRSRIVRIGPFGVNRITVINPPFKENKKSCRSSLDGAIFLHEICSRFSEVDRNKSRDYSPDNVRYNARTYGRSHSSRRSHAKKTTCVAFSLRVRPSRIRLRR
ncbi:MAG: hypothetical protein C9356_18570 [Oleiphilus sp.]|nr:MAG: hypothetical protein C9356_18570 [Oleiphilus sp.]